MVHSVHAEAELRFLRQVMQQGEQWARQIVRVPGEEVGVSLRCCSETPGG